MIGGRTTGRGEDDERREEQRAHEHGGGGVAFAAPEHTAET